jgi:hypothetical protein
VFLTAIPISIVRVLVGIYHFPLTMGYVIYPVTVIDGTICIDQFTFTLFLVIYPLALVYIPIGKFEFSTSMLKTPLPFTLVDLSYLTIFKSASSVSEVVFPLTCVEVSV